jgi:hypothetical protein
VRRLTAVVLALGASLAASASTGAAAAEPPGTIRLVSQTAWVTTGGEFALRLRVTTKTPDDLEVAVTVYPAVGSRSAFDETLTDRVRGSAVSVNADPLADLPVDADGTVTIRLPIQDPNQARDPQRIRLRGAGVYPVAVELRGTGGGARVDRFVTHLINLPDVVNGPKLATALVLPIAASPALQRDGTRKLSAADAISARSIVAAIETYGEVPLTVLPQPETLQALALSGRSEDREAATALPTAAGSRMILAAPYVRLNEPAYAGDLATEELAQRRRGIDVVTQLLGRAPESATAVVDDGLDDATANRLADAHIERVIVREKALVPLTRRTTLTQPFQLRGRSGRRLPAVAADDGLSAHFSASVPAPLAAHQLLADLAVLYFDSPGVTRGVAIVPPSGWRASPEFLAPLLDGVQSSPILLPVDGGGLFAAVPPAPGSTRGSALQRDAAPSTAAPLPVAGIRSGRRQLAALEGLSVGANPDLATLEDRLLVSQSADLRVRQRADYLDAALAGIRHELRSIRVPPNQSITLTARRGEIPITILRDVPFPVRVVVQLTSDKLQFPDGSITAPLVLQRRNTTIRFTVQARTSGTFPLEVTLRSPDGKVVLSTGRFTIRSRAASGVGVIISVSALCFLVLWWGRHVIQARRTRHGEPIVSGGG